MTVILPHNFVSLFQHLNYNKALLAYRGYLELFGISQVAPSTVIGVSTFLRSAPELPSALSALSLLEQQVHHYPSSQNLIFSSFYFRYRQTAQQSAMLPTVPTPNLN